jgi:hypothetical protein
VPCLALVEAMMIQYGREQPGARQVIVHALRYVLLLLKLRKPVVLHSRAQGRDLHQGVVTTAYSALLALVEPQ